MFRFEKVLPKKDNQKESEKCKEVLVMVMGYGNTDDMFNSVVFGFTSYKSLSFCGKTFELVYQYFKQSLVDFHNDLHNVFLRFNLRQKCIKQTVSVLSSASHLHNIPVHLYSLSFSLSHSFSLFPPSRCRSICLCI